MSLALERTVVPGMAVLLAAACLGGGVCAQSPSTEPLRDLRIERFDFSVGSVRAEFAPYDPRPLEAGTARFDRGAFFHAHLLPRMNSQFVRLAAYRYLPDGRSELERFVLRDEVTDSAGYRAARATKKAVRDFLLEKTSLDRIVRGVRGDREAGRAAGREAALRWGGKISHGLPELTLRYQRHDSVVRVGVGASGDVGLEWSHSRRMTYARIVIGYDADRSTYDLYGRLSF